MADVWEGRERHRKRKKVRNEPDEKWLEGRQDKTYRMTTRSLHTHISSLQSSLHPQVQVVGVERQGGLWRDAVDIPDDGLCLAEFYRVLILGVCGPMLCVAVILDEGGDNAKGMRGVRDGRVREDGDLGVWDRFVVQRERDGAGEGGEGGPDYCVFGLGLGLHGPQCKDTHDRAKCSCMIIIIDVYRRGGTVQWERKLKAGNSSQIRGLGAMQNALSADNSFNYDIYGLSLTLYGCPCSSFLCLPTDTERYPSNTLHYTTDDTPQSHLDEKITNAVQTFKRQAPARTTAGEFEDDARPYIIVGDIGKGSFATMYKGYHENTRQTVTIKQVKCDSLTTKLFKNLQSKIRILKSLAHRHITKLIDIVRKEKHIYLIMEYCAGGDLTNYIKKLVLSNGTSLRHFCLEET
ncbi:hypothetical protein CVT25_004476 [Psilocybe cyanescens]|uniref:non-specific serine/threonine protein kinase n=1 Tax=Psilocybe cyanescens TaxID=93625 RepID=A0A409X2H6_PSICY|nr:hypothetical protein CVT25_004476 [Psilocybe cyanescens]